MIIYACGVLVIIYACILSLCKPSWSYFSNIPRISPWKIFEENEKKLKTKAFDNILAHHRT